MRADRLVATLLLLQSKGQVTAAQVATQLEVSVRTARRDLEALAMAGIPVYSQAGRNGGWSLIGGAKTDLSGLTAAEARTLFLVAGPSATVAPELRAALRKLVHALPEPFRNDVQAAAAAVVIDPVSWQGTEVRPPEQLDVLQQAVIDARQVELRYTDRAGTETVRVVHPLGLVSKGNIWYLVADTDAGRRTFRLSRIASLEVTDRAAQRPAGFDLAEAWAETVAGVGERPTNAWARALVSEGSLNGLRAQFGRDLTVGARRDDGRLEVVLAGPSAESIARRIAGWAAFLEIDPASAVGQALAAIGRELLAHYDAE